MKDNILIRFGELLEYVCRDKDFMPITWRFTPKCGGHLLREADEDYLLDVCRAVATLHGAHLFDVIVVDESIEVWLFLPDSKTTTLYKETESALIRWFDSRFFAENGCCRVEFELAYIYSIPSIYILGNYWRYEERMNGTGSNPECPGFGEHGLSS